MIINQRQSLILSKICDLNDQLLNWASATAEAKDTAPTTAAALSATSTVTAAVYSQGFLKFLGDPGAAPSSDQPLRGPAVPTTRRSGSTRRLRKWAVIGDPRSAPEWPRFFKKGPR